ncbi:hypothetical protein AMATHDRAFT_76446 [Amanita thiersii Skay4041]|uniref:RING-type domain-containing protein n=1 Tax=Amanita thiersii Skay4041 TaxID=703135 RepID=A0A2A9NMP4_9AGAR|nr:hypothetical protein AMATHDRAFT_76446 [Amanita thiersii Skay4041]
MSLPTAPTEVYTDGGNDSNEHAASIMEKEDMNGHARDEAQDEVAQPPPIAAAADAEEHEDPGVDEDKTGKDEEDEEEDEDEDDDDDEEEEEPSLKYEYIVGAIPELLKKDSASALAIVNKTMALGTHGGIVHLLDLAGTRLKSYKPHMASIVDISVDVTGDFIATASIDGQVVIRSMSTSERYFFDMKRPMRTVTLEPNFSKRSSRAFVCGGLAGSLVLREKGWLGHKETLLHSGEGPIYQVRWRGRFIAWANDLGVKIYDYISQTRITFIDRPPDSPRPDLFKCSLYWQDDSTLLIAWANTIKVARIRTRPRGAPANPMASSAPPFLVEVTGFLQLECMVSGIATHPFNNYGPVPFLNDASTIHPASPIPPSVSILSPLYRSPSPTTASSIRSGHVFHSRSAHLREASTSSFMSHVSTASKSQSSLSTFLVVGFTPPQRYDDEMTDDRMKQARKAADPPDLRIITRSGEEMTPHPLDIPNCQAWGCNDYGLVEVESWRSALGSSPGTGTGAEEGRSYVMLSPRSLILVRPRDRRDHISWLVEKGKYEEALDEAEELESELDQDHVVGLSGMPAGKDSDEMTVITTITSTTATNGQHVGEKEKHEHEGRKDPLSVAEIGQKYIEHLFSAGDYLKAARICSRVCGQNVQRWESWIFAFAERRQLQTIIPYIPFTSPTLDRTVYDMVMAHFLVYDQQALLTTIKEWPKDIYDLPAIVVAIRDELDKVTLAPYSPVSPPPSSYSYRITSPTASTATLPPNPTILMECLAELYTINRQYGKALPYYLRLRRSNVFDLIREHNLFTDVQDQVLLLVEFDNELMERRKREAAVGMVVDESRSDAITLLVNNIHSIPITRVVQQLQSKSHYLFLYLDALVSQDPHLVSNFADLQVKLYAEYATPRLIDFLRTSSYYSLEQAFNICKERDLVPEMVFLLGRMGNNKQALMLIIERLGDVHRAIDFAKEQNDDDLWEDLLRYSETRPTFIRGLLENVGVEISPIRLIRRIKNGLEIPGLKDALIKILQDFHLQISLLEGCQTILNGDSAELSRKLQKGQSSGFFLSAKTVCPVCSQLVQERSDSPVILYLCRHIVHSSCLPGSDQLPEPPDQPGLSGRIAYESIIRAKVGRGCPVCFRKSVRART